MLKKIKLQDTIINYEIKERHIKHPRMEFKTGHLKLILPKNYPYFEDLLIKNQNWILKQNTLINLSKNYNLEYNRSEYELKEFISNLLNIYKEIYDLNINSVGYRKMKKRWGSCDTKNNLKFNKNLKFLPNHLIEYVVFHEIIHLKEFSHNKKFYYYIKNKYPNYKQLDEELVIAWFAINIKN